jgi:Mlc titration factor MtfA (ptsG expression regulator)
MQGIFQKLNSFFTTRSAKQENPHRPTPEVVVSQEIVDKYSMVIGSVFSYFNDLSPEHKEKFAKRTYQYRADKKFHFVGMEQSEDAAILVSASAIQVTFGLDNYMMSYFKDIYVLSDAYQMDNEEELYIGHVAPDGIYLSFKHFLYGYSHKNTSDNVNVAVHEMAHALLYNNFFVQYGGPDTHFRLNYEKFSSSTGPILANVIANRRSYLRSYAFSNLHEFWAVSVEAFFENPAGLKLNMPELYEALCRVLNQDPTTKNKTLKSDL